MYKKYIMETSKKYTMKNKFLKTLAVAAIGLMPMNNAQAEVHGNVKYINSEKNEFSYIQNNNFYKLPFGVKGYTFFELYKNKGYYGKTSLEKEIYKGIALKTQTTHINEPVSQHGIGASLKIPGTSLKLSHLPSWVDKQGKKIDKKVAGFYFSLDNLPYGLDFFAFGEWNTSKSPEWSYGEIEFYKDFGNYMVSYNPAFKGKTKPSTIPRVEHRIAVGVNF